MEFGDELGGAIEALSALPAVLGVALTGSRARQGMATEYSDADLIVFVKDALASTLPTLSGIDLAVYRASAAASPRLPEEDFDEWYNRAAFLHALPLFERTPGSVSDWIARQCALSAMEAGQVGAYHLDGYLNLAIRALKSQRDGRRFAAALDSAEAVGWALTTIFALENRVRPFNKYLEWELRHYPLDASRLSGDAVLSIVSAVIGGDVGAHREMFALVAPVAESAGLGAVIADWGSDLAVIAARA